MAIFFSRKETLSRFKPKNGQFFTEQELSDILGGENITPTKMGPIWMLENEDKKNTEVPDDFHLIATDFLKRNVWGNLLIVSSFELPKEWDLLEEADAHLSAELIDAGFIKTMDDYCREAGITIKWVGPIEGSVIESVLKEKYNYYPKKQDRQTQESDDFKKFLVNTIPFILSYVHEPAKEMTIYKDDQIHITVLTEDDKIDTMKQVISYCLETEKYEEAAELKKIYDGILEP